MTARISWQFTLIIEIGRHTTSFQITEPRLPRRLTAQVEKDRPARLIISRVEKVPLLESVLGMRGISFTVRKVINLHKTIRYRSVRKIIQLLTGWSK